MTKQKIFSVSYTERFIWLEEKPIDNIVALGFEKILRKLNTESNKPIRFYICGPGGDFFASLKIFYLIKQSPSPITFIAFKKVHSACFWLTQITDIKVATANTKFSFHNAIDCYSKEILKNSCMSQKDYQRRLNRLQIIDAIQLIFFTHRGRPISRIFNLFLNEATISAKEALKLKLIDDIYDKADFEKDRSFIFNLKNSCFKIRKTRT